MPDSIIRMVRHCHRLKKMVAMVAVMICGYATAAHTAEYVPIPGGLLTSVLATDADPGAIRVNAFEMRSTPVTNSEYLAFVEQNRQWQRGRTPAILADASYLHQWQKPTALGETLKREQPVVSVSWFAAQAFCESEGARLPSWSEWEYVAAADGQNRDARSDPVWRARILSWYSQSSNVPMSAVGGMPNAFGVRDMHGLIWEWVDDFNALMVSADSRNQGDPEKLQFCGAGAISLKDRDNYAVLMRIALLSSVSAVDTTNNLGFRCVRQGAEKK